MVKHSKLALTTESFFFFFSKKDIYMAINCVYYSMWSMTLE